MENFEIKISVIMPVYNSGDYLRIAVKSVLEQNMRKLELILVDDGSTDGSAELCDKFAEQDSRVVVLHQKNQGICRARNNAITIARGEYIGFSDHDDEIDNGAYATAYKYAQLNDLDVVKFGRFSIMTKGQSELKNEIISYPRRVYCPEELDKYYFDLLLSGALNCVWDGIYRADFIKRNNVLFDGDTFVSGGEDIDYNSRVISFRPRIGTISEVFYHHYIRVSFSTSTKYCEKNIMNAIDFPMRLDDYLRPYNPLRLYEDMPSAYAEVILHYCIGSAIYNMQKTKCDYSKSKKIEVLRQLRCGDSIRLPFYKAVAFSFSHRRLRYAVLFWTFKYKFFSLCLALYGIRNFRDFTKYVFNRSFK